MVARCPWCSAPRDSGESCPKCGANYAKADLIRKQGKAAIPVAPAVVASAPAAAVMIRPGPLVDESERNEDALLAVEDPKQEFYLCVAAIPVMLALGLLFHLVFPGMQRIFFGMPVHELGHAVAAWFTGHWAIPALWVTPHAQTRGLMMPIILFGAIGYLGFRAGSSGERGLLGLAVLLLGLQVVGTFVLRQKTATMLIIFGGDGIGMVLAAALMASFFFGKKTNLYRGSLRWGFSAIGAAAFSDMFSVWWGARSDFGKVPFGEFESSGNLSDATKLVDDYGWDTKVMIGRFVMTGIVSFVVLAGVYAWGVWQAWKKVKEKT